MNESPASHCSPQGAGRFGRIAVYRSGGIGDVLLLVPTLRALKKAFANASLELISRSDVSEVLMAANIIDSARSDVQVGLHAFAARPFSDNLTGKQAEALAIVFTSGSLPAYQLPNSSSMTVITRDPFPLTRMHEGEHLLLALHELGMLTDWGGPGSEAPLRIEADPEVPCLVGMNSDTVILHPGSGAIWKRAPVKLFESVARKLVSRGFEVVLAEGPAEEGLSQRMELTLPTLKPRSLLQLARLLSRVHAYIGNDSGITHLAGLVGVSTVALYGPTDPFVWGPLGPRVRVVRACTERAAGRTVRACFDPACMEAITPEDVLRAVPGS